MEPITSFGGSAGTVTVMAANKKPVFGIDLGTTNSAISIVAEGDASTPIQLTDGSYTMPSCVMFDHTKVVVGRKAYENRAKECTVYSVKRLMQDPHAIVRVKDLNDKLEFKPEEISAEILKGLVGMTGNLYGKVEDVIVTVPAYFDQNGVNATKRACELAGLNLIGIANEPTAASLCYDLSPADGGTKDVVVYDLGGGTFDVTLMRITESDTDDFESIYGSGDEDDGESKSSVMTLAIDGDTHLGGDDIDDALLEIVCEKLKKAGTDVSKLTREYREGMKLRLEGFKKQDVDGTFIMAIHTLGLDGREIDTEVVVGPDDFRKSSEVVFNKTKVVLDRLLRSVDNNADTIVLVGGSTKNRWITRALMREYPSFVIDDALSPDLSVSMGAAIQGKVKKFGDGAVQIFDILPLSIGIKDGDGRLVPIISRGKSLPAVRTVPFSPKYDDQEVIRAELFQGNSRYVSECTSLGVLRVPIPNPGKADDVRVNITLSVSVDRLMKCTVGVGETTKELWLDLSGETSHATAEQTKEEKMITRLQYAGKHMTAENADILQDKVTSALAAVHSGADNVPQLIQDLKDFVKGNRVAEEPENEGGQE